MLPWHAVIHSLSVQSALARARAGPGLVPRLMYACGACTPRWLCLRPSISRPARTGECGRVSPAGSISTGARLVPIDAEAVTHRDHARGAASAHVRDRRPWAGRPSTESSTMEAATQRGRRRIARREAPLVRGNVERSHDETVDRNSPSHNRSAAALRSSGAPGARRGATAGQGAPTRRTPRWTPKRFGSRWRTHGSYAPRPNPRAAAHPVPPCPRRRCEKLAGEISSLTSSLPSAPSGTRRARVRHRSGRQGAPRWTPCARSRSRWARIRAAPASPA